MDLEQLSNLTYCIDKCLDFTKGTFETPKDIKLKDFDMAGFNSRWDLYKQITKENKLNVYDAAEKNKIDYDLFLLEVQLYASLNPGKVSVRYLSSYFKFALEKQKEIDAICWLKENYTDLSVDYICERLEISEKEALRIVKQHKFEVNMPANQKQNMRLSYIDIINNESIQKPIIKFFNENPEASIGMCIKATKLNLTEAALRNALGKLIESGYKIPCKIYSDPVVEEKEMAEIVAYKEKNLYAAPRYIAKEFNTTEHRVLGILNSTAEQYREEKVRSYELYFKAMLDEIDEVGRFCIERFMASPNSSSRWLEIKQMGLEKKIRMLGLNAPAELRVQQDIQVHTKEDRDAIVTAYMETQMLDITPENIK